MQGDMEDLVQPVLAFVAAHAQWAGAVMFATAFIESSAFLSLCFPGTSLLIAAGTLVSAGSLPAPPVFAGATLGAVLGYWASFWIGRRYGRAVERVWPLSHNPQLLPHGIRFFARHGGKSVFIGRFYGPLRASIPLAAGVMQMRHDRFWLAAIASALVWAPMLLGAGDVVGEIGARAIGGAGTVVLVFGGLALFGALGVAWALVKSARVRH